MSQDIDEHHVSVYYHHWEDIKAKGLPFLPIISIRCLFCLTFFGLEKFVLIGFGQVSYDNSLVMFLTTRTEGRKIALVLDDIDQQ